MANDPLPTIAPAASMNWYVWEPTLSARGPTDVVVTAVAVPVVESIRYVHPARTFVNVTVPPQAVPTTGTGGTSGGVQATMLNAIQSGTSISWALASRNWYLYEPIGSLIGPTIPLAGTVGASEDGVGMPPEPTPRPQ